MKRMITTGLLLLVGLSPFRANSQELKSFDHHYVFQDEQNLIASTQFRGHTIWFRVNTERHPDTTDPDPIHTLLLFSESGTMFEAQKTGAGEFKIDNLPKGTYTLQTEDLGGQKLYRKPPPSISNEMLAQEILRHRGLTLEHASPTPTPTE